MTDSTAGASASLVTMHLAFEAWSRYKISLAVNWDVPGIKTIPGKKATSNSENSPFIFTMFTQHDPSHRKAELLAKNLFFQNKEQSLTHVLKAQLGEFVVKE